MPTLGDMLNNIEHTTETMGEANEIISTLTIKNNHLAARLETETQALTQMGYLYHQLLAGEKSLRARLELAERVTDTLVVDNKALQHRLDHAIWVTGSPF